MILGGELDFTGGFKAALGLAQLFPVFGFIILIAPVESDGCFEHQEDVVSRPLDFADRLRDPVRLGKGIVDRVSQFLHETLQRFIHAVPP